MREIKVTIEVDGKIYKTTSKMSEEMDNIRSIQEQIRMAANGLVDVMRMQGVFNNGELGAKDE
jgi:hypothetical protein